MVVSSGFLDHAAEVYLRTNGLIMSAQSAITSLNLNRTTTEWSQAQPPQSAVSNTLQLQPPLQQSTQANPSNMQVANIKTNNNNGQLPPARAILICHPNSHPFQTRNIQLEPRNEVKVGRSVPRSRVEESNAIFDCKVLSRNHAIIWFHEGKFFIKDTGSSNGTFINSQRIKTNEPYEISSGDIVQFGVDVTENSRKETHGCIIAALKLITPDGVEKTSYPSSCNFDNDIFRLKQIMHEAFLRELILEEKLLNLQKEVLTTRTNSSNTWQAMIHEDLLLSRIDILENKLLCYQKNITNEKLQEEIIKLQDDKSLYQKSAKEALKKVYQDRMAVIQKFTKFEQLWQSSEDELALLRSQLVASNENNEKLSQEVNNANAEGIRAQIVKQEFDCMQIKESFEAAKRENDELKNRLQLIESINETEMRMATNENGSDSSDKNKNITMWNKQAITHWMNNSDLKLLKESDEIIDAMCNDAKNKDFLKIDSQKCSQLYDKLLNIEKKLATQDNKNEEGSISETLTIKSDESVSSTINDGNQNNEETNDGNRNKEENDKCDDKNDGVDVATFRSVIGELKELYNEFILQIKIMQKDLSRAAKCDELESKLIETMLELQSVQNEQRKESQVNTNDSNLKNNNNNNNQINGLEAVVSVGATTVASDLVAVTPGTVATFNGQNTIKRYGNDAQSDDDNDNDDDDDGNGDDDDNANNDQSHRQRNNNNYNINNNIVAIDSNAEQFCDTISISTVDTNNSSTKSINTETNSDDVETIMEQISTASNLPAEKPYGTITEQHLNAINGSHLSSENYPIDKWLGEQSKPLKYTTRLSGSKAAAIAAELAAAGLCDDDSAPKSYAKDDAEASVASGAVDDIGAVNCSDYDYSEEKEALESFDRIIEEECKLINETDILREEELVKLKQRCLKLNDDNVSLREEVEILRLNSNKQITLLMYTAPLAALIGYLFSLIFS